MIWVEDMEVACSFWVDDIFVWRFYEWTSSVVTQDVNTRMRPEAKVLYKMATESLQKAERWENISLKFVDIFSSLYCIKIC